MTAAFKLILLSALMVTGQGKALAMQDEGSNTRENPFKVNVSYTGDVFTNMMGGVETGVRYMDNIDLNFEINFGALPLGLDGTTFHVYGLGNQGSGIAQISGDLQGISNIESENSWRIFEVWAQKKFFLTNSSILVGLYDINSEFNTLHSSLLFINSSHGLDPTIALSGSLGPSTFPYTSLAARIKMNPFKGVVIQGAVLDGVPSDPGNTSGTKVILRKEDGLFLIGEIGIHSLSRSELQLRNRVQRLQNLLDRSVESDDMIAFGGWYYTKEKESWVSASDLQNEYGLYALGEYQVYPGSENFPAGIKVFARAGLANAYVSRLNGFLSGGLVLGGLIKKREKDKTGLAVAHASASTHYLDAVTINGEPPSQAETNIELTHKFVWNNYFQMQANFQYIFNPGLNTSLDDALATGIRIIIGF